MGCCTRILAGGKGQEPLTTARCLGQWGFCMMQSNGSEFVFIHHGVLLHKELLQCKIGLSGMQEPLNLITVGNGGYKLSGLFISLLRFLLLTTVLYVLTVTG